MNENAVDSIARHLAFISGEIEDQSDQWRAFIAMAGEMTAQLARIADGLDAAKVLAERREKDRSRKRSAARHSAEFPRKERTEEAKEGKFPHTPSKEEREEEKKDLPVCSRVCAREAVLSHRQSRKSPPSSPGRSRPSSRCGSPYRPAAKRVYFSHRKILLDFFLAQ